MNTEAELNTLEMLSREVGKIINQGAAPSDVGLTELGVDSLNVVELIVFCEQLYGNFDPDKLTLDGFTTLADLDRQLKALGASSAE